ncbi:MAG: hypothetical protein JSW04_09360 [Desulfobacterales bacterium]|nr:MAG: hypothetical protein JSV38_10810 [Desulfobacterales bacterium]UCD88668.1 MAG: hypothetical protein JSW04_09360 [Desulfobacterales bacterium]
METLRSNLKTIMDLEKLNTYNAEGCAACGRKFALGEPVVLACGFWEGVKYVHEHEAVFDSETSAYYERKCYASRK